MDARGGTRVIHAPTALRPLSGSRFRFCVCAQQNNCAVEGDSPIFADTKIGTVPFPQHKLFLRWAASA